MAYAAERVALYNNGTVNRGTGRPNQVRPNPIAAKRSRAAAAQYKVVGVETQADCASPYKMVLMLLEGVLSRIATAKGCIEQKQIACKGEKIGQSITILAGLRASLDMEAGGDLSQELDGLYRYCEQQLLNANLKNSIEILDEVSGHLSEILEAWKMIPDSLHKASIEQIRRDSLKGQQGGVAAGAM